MRPALVILLLVVLATPARAVTRTVPGDHATIQQALDASTAGDVVLVAPGTYSEHLVLNAGRSGVKLRSQSGPAVTILDGTNNGPVIVCSFVSSATEIAGFTIRNGLGLGGGLSLHLSSARIEGNVVRNNRGMGAAGGIYVDGGAPVIVGNEIVENSAPSGSGGGIYLDHRAEGVIEDNVVARNSCGGYGGGISIWEGSGAMIAGNQIASNEAALAGGGVSVLRGSSPTLRSNRIESNRSPSGRGGGLFIAQDAHSLVEENRIVANQAFAGAGVFIDGVLTASPRLVRNRIQDNAAPNGSGGGIYCDHGATPVLEGNLIVRNTCGAYGGGLTIWDGSRPDVRANTIVLNAAALAGGGVFVTRNSHPGLMNNIVALSSAGGGLVVHDSESTLDLQCNDVHGNASVNYAGLADPTGAQGNISQDPAFCDVARLDFHLQPGSPCAPASSSCGQIGALDVGCGGGNAPPDCGAARAVQERLWPANYRMTPVEIVGITDPDGDLVTIRVVDVLQDEPVRGRESRHCPDAAIDANGRAQVRAERATSGAANGRVYHLRFVASDGRGGECEGEVTVCVPLHMTASCVDEGPGYRSVIECSRTLTLEDAGELEFDAIEASAERVSVVYRLPDAAEVEIGVFDVAGRRLGSLDRAVREAGTHRAEWALSSARRGVYFCRLRAGEQSLTRSFIVR